VAEQIAVLIAVSGGVFDSASLADVAAMERAVCRAMRERLPDVSQRIEAGEMQSADEVEAILRAAREACADSLHNT